MPATHMSANCGLWPEHGRVLDLQNIQRKLQLPVSNHMLARIAVPWQRRMHDISHNEIANRVATPQSIEYSKTNHQALSNTYIMSKSLDVVTAMRVQAVQNARNSHHSSRLYCITFN